MKYFIKAFIIIFVLALISTCSVFLGSDPDNSPQGIFDSIWNDFNKTYALFDIKSIDWDSVYDTHVGRIYSGMGDRELFKVCSDMLGELNDAHVRIASSFEYFNSGDLYGTSNMEPFNLNIIKTNYLNSNHTSTEDGMFVYGTFKDKPTVGYIYIKGFAYEENTGGSQDWVKTIDSINKNLSGTDSLVLDLRANTGGLPANVDFIANRFAAVEKDYVSVHTKNGTGRNDFSSPVYYTIKPEGITYTKPVILLTNAQTVSGGEWFTLALRSQSHVTHAGSVTTGALSLSLHRFLVNGWSYWVSVQIVRDMQGICPEAIGITPENQHIKTNTVERIALNIDDQLEYALSILPY